MAENNTVTIITESRNLRTLPFIPPEHQLSVGKAWEDWLEEIEREFRYFKITSAQDKKNATIIYGGQEIARLARSLPDPEDPNGELDEYNKLQKKLNDYFIPKKNKHYARYIFLKMEPKIKETTIAYAARLREMAHDGCNFGSMFDERILEHLIQTIEDSALIQKCISKSWTLQEFLTAARQTEDISTQMHDMKPPYWNIKIHKVREQQMNVESSFKDEEAQPCSYCGLTRSHPKGRNCPAYRVQCEICNKYDHFTSVCRFNGRRQHTMNQSPKRQPDEQMKQWKIKKANEDYSETESSSDDEFLTSGRIKTVNSFSEENQVLSIQIDSLQDRVSSFGAELEVAKKMINS